MPMDQTTSYDYYWDRARPEYKFCFWPRRCYETQRWIWMRTAYKFRRVITGPGEPVVEDRWVGKHEFMTGVLKGKYKCR
jgi:hypothetical protein